VDAGQICRMDLSAAFDSVDHGGLIYVLERRFACHDVVKDLFHSYLTGRTRAYCVGSSSVPTRLMCSVPHGSIIGPCQFTAYTEDLKDVVNLMSYLYAYDKQMLAKLVNHLIDWFNHYSIAVRSFTLAYQRWCSTLCVLLNPDKMEFIYFGLTAQL